MNFFHVHLWQKLTQFISKQGNWLYLDLQCDSDMMYRGQFSTTFPESNFPELEKKYYHKTLNEQFPETDKEIAKDIERRHLLKKANSMGTSSLSLSLSLIH